MGGPFCQATSPTRSFRGRISISCRWCLSRCDKPVRVERTEWTAPDGRCAALRGATRRSATSPTADQVGVVALRQARPRGADRSEEHTSELQSLAYLVCRLLLEKKKSTM